MYTYGKSICAGALRQQDTILLKTKRMIKTHFSLDSLVTVKKTLNICESLFTLDTLSTILIIRPGSFVLYAKLRTK